MPQSPEGNTLERFLAAVGRHSLGLLRGTAGMALLLREATTLLGRWLTGRVRLPRGALSTQMVRVGVRAIPIVLMTNLFVGMILAMSIAGMLNTLGAMTWLPKVIAVAMTRELAPLITAIVMSGFVGAAIAAELGAMTASEEILALQTSAVSPLRFLVLPRLIAVMAMLFCLTIFAYYASIFGGYLVGVGLLHIPGAQYIEMTRGAIYVRDIFHGLVKAEVFAVIITTVACYQGLNVSGGAEGVGRATTDAVVRSIVLLIAANLVMTFVFNWLLAGVY